MLDSASAKLLIIRYKETKSYQYILIGLWMGKSIRK